MAITKIKPIHQNENQSVAQSLKARIDYINNPEKTNGCELVTAYKCDRFRATQHFELTKNLYHQKTGRRRKDEVLAYSVIQSFKSSEVTPELANEVGYELALQFTKGQHNFVIATHVDTDNIHNHIIWSATNLDCDRKFNNFYNSHKALSKINDLICLKNDLSIIEKPQGKGLPYHKYVEEKSNNYLSTNNSLPIINKNNEVSLLIDIENAISKKGRGYELWASKFNVKQLAKMISFLTDNDLTSYEKLTERADSVTDNFNHYMKDIKQIEQKMNDVSTLQKAVYTFAKNKKIYNEYKKTGYSQKFKQENITEILLYEGAKKTFKELNTDKTLPKVADLKVEYAKLLADKKKLYSQYNIEKNEYKDILNAKKNIEILLEMENDKNKNDRSKEKNRN